MNLTITASAADKISSLCAEYGKPVRLGIESGGCNGFNKVWGFCDLLEATDQIFYCGSGKLVVDSVSLSIIENATVDYKDDLGGSYFTVSVPAAKSSCGCGTSFSI